MIANRKKEKLTHRFLDIILDFVLDVSKIFPRFLASVNVVGVGNHVIIEILQTTITDRKKIVLIQSIIMKHCIHTCKMQEIFEKTSSKIFRHTSLDMENTV